MRRGAEGWFKKLSEDQRAAIALANWYGWVHSPLSRLPADKVNDPELSRLLRLYPVWNETPLSTKWAERESFLERPMLIDCGLNDWEGTYRRYPIALNLAEYEIERNLDHVLLYINAVYAANNKEVE